MAKAHGHIQPFAKWASKGMLWSIYLKMTNSKQFAFIRYYDNTITQPNHFNSLQQPMCICYILLYTSLLKRGS